MDQSQSRLMGEDTFQVLAPRPKVFKFNKGLLLGLYIVSISMTLLALLFVFGAKTSGVAKIFMVITPLFSFGVALFVMTRKVLKDSQQNSEASNESIIIHNREVSFPGYLLMGSGPRQSEPLVLDIAQIKDFDTIPGSKNTKPHFSIELSFEHRGKKRFSLYNTLDKANTERLYKSLHQASGLSDERSPFGMTAKKIRQNKNSVTLLATFSLIIAIMVTTFLNVLFPPVYFYAGLIEYAMISLPSTLVLTLILKQTVFKAAFKQGVGREMSLFTLLATSFGLCLSVTIVANVVTKQNKESFETVVVDKFRRKSKNSYHYYAVLDLEYDWKSQFYNFNERPTVSVTSSKYKRLELGKTKARVTIERGLASVPIITDSEVRTKKRKPMKLTKHSKGYKLKHWQAQFPDFPEPDEYREVRWPNGQIKSTEPLVNGKVHGEAIYHHANGQLYTKIKYVEGQKHGRHKNYREDGSLEGEFSYKMGKLHGTSLWYNEKGEKTNRVVYKEGEPY